ncbi:hypothetical protein BDP27DRAFT_1424393 [Rhodocollybia butyracea]|uniref:Uncharacterized protein n=1 Tax=Rhodocollybia butyracea TaxID=206335 RepID=A0A9P5U4F2_9AGAR|nr:hypothetical protein BDP27DRAFT_1424393 [Rhodocollybia butyracea]
MSYELHPTYPETLPANFSQSSDHAKAIFGLILLWQHEIGSTTVQDLMSCAESTLKHHTTVNMGIKNACFFGAIMVKRCSECIDRDQVHPWTSSERFDLLRQYTDWLIKVKDRDALKEIIPQILAITELGRATQENREFKQELMDVVAMLDKNHRKARSSIPTSNKRKRDEIDEGREGPIKISRHTISYTQREVEALIENCKKIEEASMDPLMLNDELTQAMSELKDTLNTFV